MRFTDDVGPGLQLAAGAPMDERDLQALMAREGFGGRRIRARSMAHERRVTAAAMLMADVVDGNAGAHLLKEAFFPTNRFAMMELNERYPGLISADSIRVRETMSVSDYSALTVDILDRLLYGYYTAAPITNEPLVKKRPLRDFRAVARYAMDGATKPWSTVYNDTALPATPAGPGEPPTERSMTQAAREVLGSTQRVTYAPQLYQGKMAINWRAIVNDDLGIFQDAVQRLAISGRRTIYSFITSLYIGSTGINTTLYNSTFANLVTTTYGAATNNPPLSFQGLIDAETVLEKMLDSDGQPITFEGQLYLWFGPALNTTAMALINAIQADISVGGGTTNTQGFPSQRLRVGTEYILKNMKPIQDKYIPQVASSAAGSIKNTIWGLMYDPNAQARPALELGMLNGYETPQLFQKAPNTMRVGGGLDPMLGDFYSMDQEYKGCLVMGGTQIDGRSTVVSDGSGS